MELTDPLKTSLSHADESSKRSRWIVFIMQLAVVLVIASVWAQEDSNWLQLRLNSAQSAVRLLTCETHSYASDKDYPEDGVVIKDDQVSQINRDEINDKAMCSDKAYLSAKERKLALEYLNQWHYSLAQAKKNVADLQQMMANRVLGITVPVLGVMFDINDLSLMAGVTFTILLSWFHFSLRRQHDNVKKVFELAEEVDRSNPNKPIARENLKTAYDLLAMTQVLTIPPGSTADSHDLSLQRRLLRLPNLIMWTAVIAQAIVVGDDIKTMKHGDALGIFVSHLETWIASCLLAYMVYRTIQCFRLMGETYREWQAAYQKVYAPKMEIAGTASTSSGKLAWLLLFVMLVLHMLGERPDARIAIHQFLGGLLMPIGRFLARASRIEEWLNIWVVIPLMALLFWSCYIKGFRAVTALALLFASVVFIDAGAHIVTALDTKLNSPGLEHTMVGFYSLPLLLLAALNFLTTVRRNSPRKEISLKKRGHAQSL